jgi:carboxyl-terminal processing protease
MTDSRSLLKVSWPKVALACCAIALGAAVVMGIGQVPATPVTPAVAAGSSIEPTERQRRVLRLVAEVTGRQHYRQAVLDDKLSSLIFERYLESLDGNRSYLLASDVAEFEKYRYELDDDIKSSDLGPAFEMFARLQQRNRERITYAIKLLDTEPDFTLDESYRFDRSKDAWASSQAELDELWRQRVKNDSLSLILAGKDWPDAQDVLRKRYERVLKRIEQVSSDDVFSLFMNAYLYVYDPHSNYFSPRSSEEYNIAMSLSYEGIGATLQLIDDYVTIVNVLPGGPASLAGSVKAQDRILGVGQGKDGAIVDVIGWRLDDVVQLIRGPVNTVVRLQVMPAGATPGSPDTIVELTRNKVTLEAQAAKKSMRETTRDGKTIKVGVIDVPSFYQDYQARAGGDADYRSTTRDVARLIGELKAEGMQALVLDLRNNGGGYLNEATGLVGLFIDKGPVVQMRETGGRIEVLDDPDTGLTWDGPLVVLVNRASASASEIFAGAIQDYGRGLIVGQQTYGKGTVQNLYPLDRYALGPKSGFGQLTVTIGKYYRVTGDSTQHRGVTPDIELPSMLSTADLGESTWDSALPWDRIKPADFQRQAGVESELPLLTRLHDGRSGHDADLLALEGDIQSMDRLRSQTSVSLNLQKRKAERAALEAERLARENKRRKALGLEPLAAAADLDHDEEAGPDDAEDADSAADPERLARENERRKTLGLEPLTREQEIEEIEAPDALLAETTQIAADAYIGSTPAGGILLSRALEQSEKSR